MLYNLPSDQALAEVIKLINSAKSILITSHRRPDDDSIGSALSVYYILKDQFPDKLIKIIYTGDIDNRWTYFENFDKVETTDDIADLVSDFELIIFLDASEYKMFSNKPAEFALKIQEGKLKNQKTINIDHHDNKPDHYDLVIQNINAGSTAELVYFTLTSKMSHIAPRLCETLLLGILGDTGYLEFIRPNQAYVYSIVQRLVTEGNIDIQLLRSKHNCYSYRVFQIIQELVKNTKIGHIEGWPPFLYSYVNRDFIEKNGYQDIEVSAASNIFIHEYCKEIKEVYWGFSISPRHEGYVTANFRSKPDSGISVRDLATDMGIGGGHERAAGGKFIGDRQNPVQVEDSIKMLFHWLTTHKSIQGVKDVKVAS